MSRPVAAAVLVLALAACTGGSGTDEPADVAASAASLPPEVDTAEAPDAGTPSSGAVTGSAASEAAPAAPATPLEPSEPFTTAELTLVSPEGESTAVPVYVAAEPEQRQRGLMDREELRADAGMVFLFPGVATSSFYMFNTLIPLSIAFFDADGEVVSVLDMEPCESTNASDCELYDPGTEYSAALEVNQGFFDEVGLEEGWTIQLPEDLPAPS